LKEAEEILQDAFIIFKSLFKSDKKYNLTQNIGVVTSSLTFLFHCLSVYLKVQSDESVVTNKITKVASSVRESLMKKYKAPGSKQIDKEMEVYSLE